LPGKAYSQWLTAPWRPGREHVRLVCFPYAGANGHIFNSWRASLPAGVELLAIQLPGRGQRIDEPPHRLLQDLVEDLHRAISPLLEGTFAFFGHSMGAIVAFELARKLSRDGCVCPARLFVSGATAPHLRDDQPRLYQLPRNQFIAALRRFNGTPREVLDSPELMELLLPAIYADFEICDTYKFVDGPPLEIPLLAFGGVDDLAANESQIKEWRQHTSKQFSYFTLPGDHFFLRDSEAALLKIVGECLSRDGNRQR
jgi:medium-chain acyl-[acyl-carrier-protein] hydrolase